MRQGSEVAEVNIERDLIACFGIFVEKVGDSKLYDVVRLPIDWSGKQCWEGCDRDLGNSVVLSKGVKECVLEFRLRKRFSERKWPR